MPKKWVNLQQLLGLLFVVLLVGVFLVCDSVLGVLAFRMVYVFVTLYGAFGFWDNMVHLVFGIRYLAISSQNRSGLSFIFCE